MRRHNGAVLYEGPSEIDSQPVVAIEAGLLRASENRKVGPSTQVYVLRADVDPVTACRTGADASVCGDCPMRGGPAARACYVPAVRAPLTVWKKWRAGAYASEPRQVWSALGAPRWFRRGGAYGNHSAMPSEVTFQWLEAGGSRGWSLYEHRWRDCDQDLRHVAMASVSTVSEAVEAADLGWRCFLHLPSELAREALSRLRAHGLVFARCPHRSDDPRTPTCSTCPIPCNGGQPGRKAPHVWTPEHGSPATLAALARLRRRLPVLG